MASITSPAPWTIRWGQPSLSGSPLAPAFIPPQNGSSAASVYVNSGAPSPLLKQTPFFLAGPCKSPSPTSEVKRERMFDFIASRGDLVRFDEYMQEHLFGETGYYTSHIEFGSDFETFGRHPIFAMTIHSLVKKHGLANRDFLEIGGGDGTFQEMYLACARKTRYTAVDASPKLSREQHRTSKTRVVVSTADDLKLPDRSVHGVVFSNELIDCLPCRVFKVRNRGGRPTLAQEGWVRLVGTRLLFDFRPAERDDFVAEYEAYLHEKRISLENGALLSLAPQTQKVLSEMNRVLDRGVILLVDYGFYGGHTRLGRGFEGIPYYRAGIGYHFVNEILRRPYETDITYEIDFGYLRWLAEWMDFGNVSLIHQHGLFQALLQEHPNLVSLLERDDPLLKARGFFVLLLAKK